MAEVVWTPDEPVTTGKVPTKRETLTQTDTFQFANDGKTFLRVTAGATESKVKVVVQHKVDGITPTAREVVVKEATKVIGPFDRSTYNDENGLVNLTFSATTGVVVEVFKVPTPTS